MKSIKLTVKQCEETGEVGLVIDNIESNVNDGVMFVAQSANIVAHDIVEHMDSDQIGTPSDELRALGCVHFGRINVGVLPYYPVYSNTMPTLSYDIASVLRDDHYNDVKDEGQVFECDYQSKVNEDVRRELRSIALRGVLCALDDDVYEEGAFNLREEAWPIYRLLVAGYARAEELYTYDYKAVDCFKAVEEAVDTIFTDITHEEAQVGAEYELQLDVASSSARIERVWDDEEERTCDSCSSWVDCDHGTENSMGLFTCFSCQCAEEISDYDRDAIVEQLESEFSVACYDVESTALLRESLAENLADNMRDAA